MQSPLWRYFSMPRYLAQAEYLSIQSDVAQVFANQISANQVLLQYLSTYSHAQLCTPVL